MGKILGKVLMAALLAAACASGLPASGDNQELVVIVNKENPVNNLSLAELRGLFLGERGRWPNGRSISLAMHAAGPERALALAVIYKMSEADYQKHFLEATFTGKVLAPPRDFHRAAEMRGFVARTIGGIGCLWARDIDGLVKVISIDGIPPGSPGYTLKK